MKQLLSKLLSADNLWGKLIMILPYVFIYDFVYENYVYKYFSYIGFDYTPRTLTATCVWVILSVLPFLVYKGCQTISSFLCLFIYIFVYIPFIHALFITYELSNLEAYSYAVVMCIFFMAYFHTNTDKSFLKNITLKQRIPFRAIEIITLLLTIAFVALRHDSMHFVNIFTEIDKLYSLRAENSEQVAPMSIILYIQGWLAGAFYPFLLICYLRGKKRMKASLIILGYVTLFMVDMQKLTFVLPFILIGFYFIVQRGFYVINHYLHAILIPMLSVLCIVLYLTRDNLISFGIGALLLLRTVCVAGWLTQLYLMFFVHNPFTYYSHINIINAVTHSYPFSTSLGMAVAYNTQNANANFFLMDGVAAAGLIGVIIIGLLFYLLLHIINSISYRYKTTDLVVLFLPSVTYLLNTSLFTTLLSNGLFILLVLLIASDNPISIENMQDEQSIPDDTAPGEVFEHEHSSKYSIH